MSTLDSHAGHTSTDYAASPIREQIDQANASGRTPVVFIHGLWLLASSWNRWAEVFDQAGFAPLSPG
ncbi:MAG TPA: alpha/beta hydrolase, partial [Chloroflexota bacterium]|nr:alpha/beta hydrolase [Chloroflexota bacterium]